MKQYGLGKDSVLRLLAANGIVRRRQPMTPTEVQRAAQLYCQGWSTVRIGRELGRHHSVILRALQRAGARRGGRTGRTP